MYQGTSNEYPQHIFHGVIRKILCGYPHLSGAMCSMHMSCGHFQLGEALT